MSRGEGDGRGGRGEGSETCGASDEEKNRGRTVARGWWGETEGEREQNQGKGELGGVGYRVGEWVKPQERRGGWASAGGGESPGRVPCSGGKRGGGGKESPQGGLRNGGEPRRR